VTYFFALRIPKPRPTSEAHATRMAVMATAKIRPIFANVVVSAEVLDATSHIFVIVYVFKIQAFALGV